MELKNKYRGMSDLANDLTEAFIIVEYSRITPLFSFSDFTPDANHLWHNDPIFHKRVKYMVRGVMEIILKHVDV